MGTIHVGWRKKEHFRCVTACEDIYTGIEKNLCFQPADLSVEKVSYEREPTAWSWFWVKKDYTWYWKE